MNLGKIDLGFGLFLVFLGNQLKLFLKIHFMPTNKTFTMLKPDTVSKNNIGAITHIIENAGFRIVAMKKTQLTANTAGRFYSIHEGKPFFDGLVEFMTSGPIIAMILEKENAIEDYRKLIGNTNPEKAEDGTIRKLFAESMTKNAVHGADSDENAAIEGSFFFAATDMY